MQKLTNNLFILILLICLPRFLFSQEAIIKGKVQQENNQVIPLATISIKDTNLGTTANDEGMFELKVPANRLIQVQIRHTGFKEKVIELNLEEGEERVLEVVLLLSTQILSGVTIEEEREAREEVSTLTLKPKSVKAIPTPFLDFNQALITGGGLGIVGNNELSSTYSVRGGNFDENLVYVNNIQIYRPFLVRSGQQEGLSFVNSELVESIEFSSGGWQAKYGDKLSSVLNIQYKEPEQTAASLVFGLLGGSIHLEGASKNGKITHVTGIRHKSARYLLNTLDTDGQYLPRFTDVQSYINFDLSGKNQSPKTTTLGVLASFANNNYQVEPETRVTRFGTIQQVFRLRVAFDGTESLRYQTFQGGVKLKHSFNKQFTTNLIASALTTREREYINLEGGFLLCDVNNNFSSADFNECSFTVGIGTNFDYARNSLDAQIYALESRNTWHLSENTTAEFGVRYDYEQIEDILDEYTFTDSSDFVEITSVLQSENELNSHRLSGYAQNTHYLGERQTLTYGVRFNYWSLNEQLLVSPRLQYSFRPNWKKDIVFNAAVGYYQQPPFYRELRNFQGEINRDLKAQTSIHGILGMDWNFTKWGRPFKFISEVYYKELDNVVAYDVDNVRLRYYANNNTEAYVYGADFRLSGEFIPGTESWFNLSLLRTQEDIQEDERGFIRRPSDQRLTFAMFFQDHLPNNPSIQMKIRFLYGSGLPYGPPNSLQFRNALSNGTTYNRVDVGFSKVIDFKEKRASSNKRGLQSIWLGLDILNLFGVDNNISFIWIEDFNDSQIAVPNSLSQRFFNLRMVVRY